MDEKYLIDLYNSYGGQKTFGSFQAFSNKIQNDDNYRSLVYKSIGGEGSLGKNYSDFESSVKKKEGTGPSLPYGSSQTQPSSGSEPSQEDSGFSFYKWAKEMDEKSKSQPSKPSFSPPKQEEVKSIMFQDKKVDVSKFGQQSFNTESELNNYIEELKKYESNPEAQKQLLNLLNNYNSIVSDIKSKGDYSFESLGVSTKKPVAAVTTATYTLDQINKGNYDPKRVDPNGHWETSTIVTPQYTEYDESERKTVTRGGDIKQSKQWVPSSEFAAKLKEENSVWLENQKRDLEYQNKIVNRQANDKNMTIFQSMGVQDFYNYDSELYGLEDDYQKGAISADEYNSKKEELNAKRAASLVNLDYTYINALSKTDPEKAQEYFERYNEIMKDIKDAGFNGWDDYSKYLQENGYNAENYISGKPSDKDIFSVVDKSDQEFLRKLRSEAMQVYSAPFLDKMYASTNDVKRYIRDSQPIINDFDVLNSNVNKIAEKYKSGAISYDEAQSQLKSLKSKEQELKSRLQNISNEYGVTQSDLDRYSMKEKLSLSQYNNYNSFSGLKEIDQKTATEAANRQRWVTENPVLGSLAYAAPNAWKHFTDMVVLETGKSLKPLAELIELGDGYGWTDRMYYGLQTYQNDRDYLYGYSGQDIDGDGQIDDLPTVAKLIDITSSGLGSVGAFAIPGSIAAKTFSGAGKLAAAGRFATNFGGAFLMMEAQAYDEALRAGLSQDDASEVATVSASLQALAEQVVNDYDLVRANPFRTAGIISMYRANIPLSKISEEALKYFGKATKGVVEQGGKEAFEEVIGQLGVDISKDLGNTIYSQNDMVSYARGNSPSDAAIPFKDAWQIKPYYDNALAGFLTGGTMAAFKSARPLSRTQMENLSYLGRNWKDVLSIIEKTESFGMNPGDDAYKQLEKDLKGISSVVEGLNSIPGFNNLTKANQDMIVSLAYRKKNIQDNMRQLGVDLPSVKDELAGIDERINLYLTGKLDYGSDKAVPYNDDVLMGLGVRNVMVNSDGSYNIEVRSDLDFTDDQKTEISNKAKEYIDKSLKNNDFRLSFLHPNTENYAVQESETGQVPVQPEAAVSEQMEEGTPQAEPKVTTEEGKEEVISTEQKNRSTDLFPDASEFAQVIGKSESTLENEIKKARYIEKNEKKAQELEAELERRQSKISSYAEVNGIGVAEYTNPVSGVVDVIMSGTSDNDYVGYVRIYENGKPTNRWTSKMSNQSGNKDAFKTMISQVQSKLPENHEYTETTNISLDGLRVYGQQLNRGYEVVTDNNGKPVMNSVSLNQATLEGVRNAKSQEEQDNLYTEMNVETREDFNKIKERVLALMPTARVLWNQANNTVNIQLPVLRKKPSVSEKTITEEGGKEKVGSDVLNRTLEVVDNVEAKIEKIEPINDEERKQAEDSLYELLNDIDSNPNLSAEQKAQMSLPIENRLQKIQDYELGTRTETRTTTQAVATGTTPKTQAKNERATIPLRTAAEESIDVTYNGRAGKLKIEDGNYVFVPNKIGRQQPKSVVIGEAAVTNRDSKFAGVESVNKKGVTTSAQITLPNGSVLGIMDTDLSIDIGIEIAKQEVGPAPQALFDVVFDEIVAENNVEIPYTKAAPKVEAAKEEEVKEQPETQQAAESDLGKQLLEGNEYNNKRKNELLKKYKSDSKKRNLISSAAVAIEAIKKIYPDLKVYLHENTEEYELATEAQGIKLSEAGAMIFDGNGNVIGVHVDLSKADGTTTPHELTHAILAKAFGDNPVLFKEFKDRVSKLLSESANKKLNDFANQEGYEDDVKSEEYLVQLAALLTENRGKIEPSILQKLMTLINNFVSRITKGNVVPFKSNAKTQALVDFFNSVALTMSTGRDVSGLQSKIRGLQDRFGQAPSESRIIQRETATPEPEVVSKQQIVGERGIENANDKVAQKDLETAKLMASNNRPSTDIKRATGWEMGADGKWRYEYPNVTLKDDLQDENDFRLVVKGYNQSQGIIDRFETKPPAIPLSEILNFGELQKAYPYIEDLYFELDDSLQSEAYGQLDIARGLVSLNPKIINQVGIDEVQKVLIHEIQHYIQDQEGFENGGNVEVMQDRIKRSQDVYKIPGLTLVGNSVEDSINYGVIDIQVMADNGVSLMDIYNGNYDKSQYGTNPEALLKAVFRPDQIQKLDSNDVNFAISKINEYAVYSAAHKDYWNMVGETEARNAAKRSETPYLERLYGQTLESTEDVLRRDQIRKDGGKIFKEMDVISNKRGLARQRMEQQNRENFGELYMKAKEINDNFETIINQLGITKICGL